MKMKKWLVTRIAHTTIEVESEIEPLQGDDKWGFEEKHYEKLEEEYRNDGSSDWEVTELI
jgi:hypothetical protein